MSENTQKHRPYEDIQGVLTGTLFVALAIVLFGKVGFVTGGTAGLALLIHYGTGVPFSVAFSLVNLPFYAFAWWRMGWQFTLKTVIAVSLLSLFAQFLPYGLTISYISLPVAAVLGGLLAGTGLLILFRHKASLGGLNVMVIYLQERFGWRAGKIQMVFDCLIVLGSLIITDVPRVAYSVLAAFILNLTLTINHKPGRYMAM